MNEPTRIPPLADLLLRWSLTADDYEVISGDLLEELQTAISGKAAARRFWHQALLAALRLGVARRAVIGLGAFCVLAFSWFAVMEAVLRHPYYPLRLTLALLIAALSVMTIISLRGGSGARWRWVQRGWFPLGALGAWAFVSNLRAPDVEGYIALMSAALEAQSLLCLLAMPPVPRS
jgi:hypothetical protein